MHGAVARRAHLKNRFARVRWASSLPLTEHFTNASEAGKVFRAMKGSPSPRPSPPGRGRSFSTSVDQSSISDPSRLGKQPFPLLEERASRDISHFSGSTRALACSRRRLADGLGVHLSDSVLNAEGARLRRGAASGTRGRVRSPINL